MGPGQGEAQLEVLHKHILPLRACIENSFAEKLGDGFERNLAGRPGLEPGYPESESGVLPIGRPPSRCKQWTYIITCISLPGQTGQTAGNFAIISLRYVGCRCVYTRIICSLP